MHLSNVITTLLASASAVSAIDTYLYVNRDCSGTTIRCNAANPGVCCNGSPQEIFGCVGFLGIPTFWNILGRGHGGGGCSNAKQQSSNNGATWINLHDRPNYSGGSYVFAGKKRDGGEEQCTSSVKADELQLVDGTKYNLTVLHDDDAKFAQILSIASTAVAAADIPADFDAIKIE